MTGRKIDSKILPCSNDCVNYLIPMLSVAIEHDPVLYLELIFHVERLAMRMDFSLADSTPGGGL